jgi:hypothetical protein
MVCWEDKSVPQHLELVIPPWRLNVPVVVLGSYYLAVPGLGKGEGEREGKKLKKCITYIVTIQDGQRYTINSVIIPQ